jgi:hypothetical protein
MENQRNGFLTTLCILTFIGSGLGLIGGLLSLVGASFIGAFSVAAGKYSLIISACTIISSGLCLFGAISMWSLKLTGYWLYLAGTGLSLLATIFSQIQANAIISELNSSFGVSNTAASGASYAGTIFAFLIAGAFVAMYTVNKKQLQ